jgi:hypothetical protein
MIKNQRVGKDWGNCDMNLNSGWELVKQENICPYLGADARIIFAWILYK